MTQEFCYEHVLFTHLYFLITNFVKGVIGATLHGYIVISTIVSVMVTS